MIYHHVKFLTENGEVAKGGIQFGREETFAEMIYEASSFSSAVPSTIYGELDGSTQITCVGCVEESLRRQINCDGDEITTVRFFPHFVLEGPIHVDPAEPCFSNLSFTVDDIQTLFFDPESFGRAVGLNPNIRTALEQLTGEASTSFGDQVVLAYFKGNPEVLSITTDIGEISIQHEVSSNSPSWTKSGLYLKDRMRIVFNPSTKLNLQQCLDSIELLGVVSENGPQSTLSRTTPAPADAWPAAAQRWKDGLETSGQHQPPSSAPT